MEVCTFVCMFVCMYVCKYESMCIATHATRRRRYLGLKNTKKLFEGHRQVRPKVDAVHVKYLCMCVKYVCMCVKYVCEYKTSCQVSMYVNNSSCEMCMCVYTSSCETSMYYQYIQQFM